MKKCCFRLLFFGKGYFVKQLLIIYRFDLHKNPVNIRSAFILTNCERLTSFRGTLMDYAKFRGRMKLEKIPENEFGLRFTVRLHLPFNRNVYRLIEIFGKLFSTPRFYRFLNKAYYIALCKCGKHL